MRFLLTVLISSMLTTPALASHGIVTEPATGDVPVVVERLVSTLKSKGMTVFATIDHAAGARKVEQTLRPTVVVIFGNPKVGTALMKCNQAAGLDLPLKILVYEDESGKSWLRYSHPDFLADRYGLSECRGVLEKMGGALRSIVEEAAR